jgi:hypothetical protein
MSNVVIPYEFIGFWPFCNVSWTRYLLHIANIKKNNGLKEIIYFAHKLAIWWEIGDNLSALQGISPSNWKAGSWNRLKTHSFVGLKLVVALK